MMAQRFMTSRQRMLAALAGQEPDHVPCSFMLFNGLKAQCKTYLEFLERQLEMGLDVFVQLPPRPPRVVSDSYNLHGLPVGFHPEVKIKEWKEFPAGERWPVLFKEYQTPVGSLRAEVYQDAEWPYGDHVPFLDDFIETRSRKFLISKPNDLETLQFLLVPPSVSEIEVFEQESAPVLEFARQHDLLVAGGWGVGADLVGWVYGLQKMIYTSYDEPEFLHRLVQVIAAWNQTRMRVVLKAGIDLYIKRAWYENCDFWSPKTWKEFVFPQLRSDVELAHAHGARFGYFITSNTMPLLEMIAEAGVDVLIGVDPAMWDLAETRRRLGGKVCLWGGVNGHLTVEQGSPEAVQAEVYTAMETLSLGGGFIISPVDNVRELNPISTKNVQALLDAWRNYSSR